MVDELILHSVGVYATKGGRLAFIEEVKIDPATNETVFVGHMLARENNQTVFRNLMWVSSGICLNSEDEKDHIIFMV